MTSDFGFEERQLVELMDTMSDEAVPLAHPLQPASASACLDNIADGVAVHRDA